ncbi:MAG: hypothetical protein CL607_15190 [Anaerolineaceae bacterium]|nr:hypothetical protein [Anaerolineaceae bacterium]
MTKTRRQRLAEAEAQASEPQQRIGPFASMSNALANLASRFIQRPRLLRIILVALIALSWVMLVFPLVDLVYFNYFFDVETRAVPAYVTAGIGLLIYMLGWYWLVGTVGLRDRMRARPVAGLYLLLGLLVFVVDVCLVIYGLVSQYYVAQ